MLFLKSTAKNPKNRYTDARAMHDDLLTVLDDDRLSETKHVYKYPEHEENTKAVEKLKNIEKSEEVVAEKIEEKEEKLSKRLIIILSVIATIIIIVLVLIVFVIPKATAPKSVKIPDVSKMTVSKAEKLLIGKKLTVNTKIEEVYDKDVKKGYVVKTEPAKNRTVKEGEEITIYKSLGIKKYPLEEYVGESLSGVKASLEANGIKVTVTKEDASEETCKYVGTDKVVWQSLASGSKVKSGDEIELKVLNSLAFPSFKGQTEDEVSTWANKNCVTLTVDYQETSDDTYKDKEQVISQSRPVGATVKNNDSVEIVISKYKKEEVAKEDNTEEKEATTSSTKTPTSDQTKKQ